MKPKRSNLREEGFTLAEVLAALVFLAIVIPVVAQGLSLASKTGATASRRYQAGLVAERVLNEAIVTTNWGVAEVKGLARQGIQEFQWTLRSEPWLVDSKVSLHLLSADVIYSVQGRDQTVTMSTLVEDPYSIQQTNIAW